MKRLLLAAMTVLMLGVSATWAGPYEDAEEAYSRGNYSNALRIFRPLAEQWNASAQFFLGLMYEEGRGVPQDYNEAVKWYGLAAMQGKAEAQIILGELYANGRGVPQDYTEAVKWYRQAAAQGYGLAQFRLGAMYYAGQGVAQDHIRAHMWTILGAVYGNAHAVKFRGISAKLMTPQQIAQAQEMAVACQQRNFKGCD